MDIHQENKTEFEKETGLTAEIPVWSEKYNERRTFLNPEYYNWYFKKLDERVEGYNKQYELRKNDPQPVIDPTGPMCIAQFMVNNIQFYVIRNIKAKD